MTNKEIKEKLNDIRSTLDILADEYYIKNGDSDILAEIETAIKLLRKATRGIEE